MKTLLVVLGAALPCYSTLFITEGGVASMVLIVTTLVGLGLSISLTNESNATAKWYERIYLAWSIHLVGIFLNIAIFNL